MVKTSKRPVILFINDKAKYNVRYRSNLMRELEQYYTVESVGSFEKITSLFSTILKLVFGSFILIVSSNIKSNLLNLTIFWRKKVLIFNGLGRYRQSKFLRTLIILLFRVQLQENLVFIQNYADFRYFRKHAKVSTEFFWMPGSGGIKRKIGASRSSVSVITRDGKLQKQIASIEEFFCVTQNQLRLILVGINKLPDFASDKFTYECVGYVDQRDIMSYSAAMLVPDGYGEGIPHSLVDAVMSGVVIYLSKVNFIQYGFYKVTHCKLLSHTERWVELYINDDLKNLIDSQNIVSNVSQKIYSFLK